MMMMPKKKKNRNMYRLNKFMMNNFAKVIEMFDATYRPYFYVKKKENLIYSLAIYYPGINSKLRNVIDHKHSERKHDVFGFFPPR